MNESLKINAPNLDCNVVNTSNIIAERDFWKREAIKNATILGEIRIWLASEGIEIDKYLEKVEMKE